VFLYVFDGAPLGLSLSEGKWHFGTFGPGRKRAFAAQAVGRMTAVVTLHYPRGEEPKADDEAELKAFLQAPKPLP
jgi:hypothetical protein